MYTFEQVLAAIDDEPLAQALEKLEVFAGARNRLDIAEWAKRELDGYGTDDKGLFSCWQLIAEDEHNQIEEVRSLLSQIPEYRRTVEVQIQKNSPPLATYRIPSMPMPWGVRRLEQEKDQEGFRKASAGYAYRLISLKVSSLFTSIRHEARRKLGELKQTLTADQQPHTGKGTIRQLMSQAIDSSGSSISVSADVTPLEQEIEQPIVWFHFSDIHFKETRPWQQDNVLESLIRDVVQNLPAEGLKPDMVFVTGDIANSGKGAEYDHALSFLQKMSHSLDVDSSRWFLVPGNHDVRRSLVSPLTKRARFDESQHVNETLEHEQSKKLYASRQQDFYKFTADFLGTARAFSEDSLWRVESIEVKGHKLAILSLNSAWTSGQDGEKGQLVLGEYQIVNALRQARGHSPDLIITLVHHPLSWLKEFDEHKSEELLRGAGGTQFLLRGHLHTGRIKQENNPDAASLEIATGACWQDSRYPHGVTSVRLFPKAGVGEVHMWRYASDGRGHWKRDNFLYENLSGGLWRFSIPKSWNFHKINNDISAINLGKNPISVPSMTTSTETPQEIAKQGTIKMGSFISINAHKLEDVRIENNKFVHSTMSSPPRELIDNKFRADQSTLTRLLSIINSAWMINWVSDQMSHPDLINNKIWQKFDSYILESKKPERQFFHEALRRAHDAFLLSIKKFQIEATRLFFPVPGNPDSQQIKAKSNRRIGLSYTEDDYCRDLQEQIDTIRSIVWSVKEAWERYVVVANATFPETFDEAE